MKVEAKRDSEGFVVLSVEGLEKGRLMLSPVAFRLALSVLRTLREEPELERAVAHGEAGVDGLVGCRRAVL